MSDTSFFKDYVPPSQRPKPPTPPPEPKGNNPWLISAPTPNLDPGPASPEPSPPQANENNPWLISAPTPNLAPASAAEGPAPVPAPLQFIPVFTAFPAIPVNNAQPQPHGQLFYSGLPVPVPNQHPFWFRNHVRNTMTSPPIQVGISAQRSQAPPASAAAGMPQVMGPLNMPNEFYCKELDGGFTLRTREQIATLTGDWTLSSIGFPYFVRKW